jgi:hypothetical protein
MVLEFAPSTADDCLRLQTAEEASAGVVLTAEQEKALQRAHTLLGIVFPRVDLLPVIEN